MCGIGAIFTSKKEVALNLEQKIGEMMTKIIHRGDQVNFNENLIGRQYALATNRLETIERNKAKQPVSDDECNVHAILDGQIYNCKEIRAELTSKGHYFKGTGDAEVVLRAFLEYGASFVAKLDGMFAFIIYDDSNSTFLIGRDHVGIKPLYYASSKDVWYMSSEMKALTSLGLEAQTLPPGSTFNGESTVRFVDYDRRIPIRADSFDLAVVTVRQLLDAAVKKSVDTDLPIAVMFSGGIDSSIVLNLAHQYHDNVTAITFGLHGSKDIEVAQRYCNENGIRQIVYTFTKQDLINNLDDAIYYGEFFEKIDAIDSAIAHLGYYIANKLGFKVSLCGEGSDEIFCGYDLFKEHPDPRELSFYRLNNLHRTDLQRVDRASMRNSVEARVLFMDSALIQYVLGLDVSYKIKNGIEKYVLREAFRDVLPSYIADRPKIRMPDGSGVKNTVIDYIQAMDQANVSSNINNKKLAELGIFDRPSLYIVQRYLSFNYPFPKARFKQVGKDYSEMGYFKFVS